MTAYSPGDKLRVTAAVSRYSPLLAAGDLVTVIEAGLAQHEPGRAAIPVVKVSTAHGPQLLGLDAVEPWDPPVYTPAEPDDVIDAFFSGMFAADPDLSSFAADADTALGAEDDAVSERLGGSVAVTVTDADAEISNRRYMGPVYGFIDSFGDSLDVRYFEQDYKTHGREGLFLLTIIEDGEEGRVVIPANKADGLIRYLFRMKKHSERPE